MDAHGLEVQQTPRLSWADIANDKAPVKAAQPAPAEDGWTTVAKKERKAAGLCALLFENGHEAQSIQPGRRWR